MPSCLVLAALLLTHDGARCARVLDDAALDRITAGSAAAPSSPGGGVVAVQSSQVDHRSLLAVDVRDATQQDARTLTLVNGAGGLTAAGVNVTSGGGVATGDSSTLRQANVIRQSDTQSAWLLSWHGDGSIEDRRLETRTASFEGQVTGGVLDLQETTSGVVKDAAKETRIVYGSGIAAAGALDARLGGGHIDLQANVTASLRTTKGACFLWWCWSDETVTSGSASVVGYADVPDASLTLRDGVACASVIASCAADASATSAVRSERKTVIPATVSGAAGGVLALGDASLLVAGVSTTSVSGSAQQGVRGLTVVNVSGGVIANGVNVIGGTLAPSPLRTTQQNVVTQRR